MTIKNLIMYTSVLAAFGTASFTYASDFPVSCAKNDGGPKDCISISNNTKMDKKLKVMCDTDKGHYKWVVKISAGTQNQCLNLDSRCEITRIFNDKKHKAKITVDDDMMSTDCNWPDEN